MVLHKKVNFLTPHLLIRCKLLIMPHLNAFECFCIPISNRLNHNCKVLITFHHDLHVERDGPHTLAIMPKSQKMWLKASLISVHLGTSSVYYKSTYSLSHSKFVCLLTLTIAFCSLRQNQTKRLFKTCTFMNG